MNYVCFFEESSAHQQSFSMVAVSPKDTTIDSDFSCQTPGTEVESERKCESVIVGCMVAC